LDDFGAYELKGGGRVVRDRSQCDDFQVLGARLAQVFFLISG